MDALQKQNQLFKSYIATLQKENDARNVQRNTLLNQIDQLTAEIQRLNQLITKSASRVIVNPTNTSAQDNEIRQLKDNNYSLSKQITNLNSKITQLTSDLKIKDAQIARISQEKQSLVKEISFLKDTQNSSNGSRNQIILLQNQISSYKLKISQISSLQSSLKLSTARISQLQILNSKIQSDFRNIQANYKRLEGDYKKIQNDFKRMEGQNRDLRSNTRNATQISTLLSTKLNLQATIRQLNGKLQWLQSNNKGLEQQKNQLNRRITNIDRQLLQAKGKLIQMKMNEDSYKSSQANVFIKQKQMEALEQMISSLKQNKKYLQKTVNDKEDMIARLESQLYSFKTSKFDSDQILREVNELKNQKIDLQKQISILIKTNQQLQLELSKTTNFELEINQLRDEKERLLKQREVQKTMLQQAQRDLRMMRNKSSEPVYSAAYRHVAPQKDLKNDNDDLRVLVERLRSQIDQLKYSPQFQSPHLSELQPHCESCSHLSLQPKSYINKRQKSPIRGAHSKIQLHNEREKQSMNRQKWQTLQKKINVLRNQNDTLKRTLFE